MTSNRWKSWQAQEPSASFTERTVAALVRDRLRRRSFGSSRWAIAGAMAAVLVGGAAWGLGGFSLRAHPLPAPPPPATIAPPQPPTPPTLLAPPPEPSPSASPPPVPRRKADAPPPTRRKVVQPRCFCSPMEAICDCF
jgi:hypothetical protein